MKQVGLFALLLLFLSIVLYTQSQNTYRVMFYNVENLFDTKHDSLKNDYQFLPDGSYHWTSNRYKQKQANVARVITSVGGWNAPALVGLCEIENKNVLNYLTKDSPLKEMKYKFIHKESPDARGIDVALLYQPQQFTPIATDFIEIKFPANPKSNTRDILYAAGTLPNKDTLHVFVNHFPSRLGGQAVSEQRRVHVASVLRSKVDSIIKVSPKANIIIMGDFNDYPDNKSIAITLNAKEVEKNIHPLQLYNLFYPYHKEGKKGSHKHQGEWGMLDQIIVIGNLLNENNKTWTNPNSAKIYDAEFLLQDDNRHLGKQPFRTYIGMKYNGGFADHLPIYIDLIVK